MNMFDLLGYVPEELEDFKEAAKEMETFLEEDGVDDFLRNMGQCDRVDGGWHKDDFALGVILGEKILKMLEERCDEK